MVKDINQVKDRKQFFQVSLSIIKLDRMSFHIIAHAMINDIPVNLVIDTGASRSVFSREYLQEHLILKINEGDEIHSAGISAEKIKVKMATAATFAIGLLMLTEFPVMLINLKKINKLYNRVAGMSIHGLLGSDFLMEMNAVIDFGKSVMILKPEKN